MKKATKIIEILSDGTIDILFPYDEKYNLTDERLGAMIYLNSVRGHIVLRYIDYNYNLFIDEKSYENIKKIINYKITYFSRILKQEEVSGAEQARQYLIDNI